MHYDEATGLYYEDSKTEETTSEKQNNTTPSDSNEKPPAEENGKQSADNIIEEKDVNPLNKKLIFICLGILAAGAIIFAVINPTGFTKKEQTQEVPAASDIRVPFFDTADYEPTYPERLSTYIQQPELQAVQRKQSTSSVNSATQKKVPESQPKPLVQQPHSLTEADIEALKAPLAVAVTDLSNKGSTNSTSANKAVGYDIMAPSYANSGMNESQYMQNSLTSLGLAGTQGTAQNSYMQQNMQSNKQNFYTEDKNDLVSGYFLGEDTIWEGTLLHVLLDTAICTDLPGEIKAHFAENVYDSLTGTKLLIPQGTVLIAEYNSSVSYSQSRVQIAWKTLIRPDGYRLNLGNMTGVDSKGASGIKGRVDEHLFEYVKAMGIISLFTAINGEFSNALKLSNNQSAQNILTANQAAVNQLGNKMIDRALDIQPTVLVKSGTSVRVFVNKTLSLPPLEKTLVVQPYKR